MNKRIVITGLGVIASTGIGKDAFWDALLRGHSGIKPVTLFSTAKLRTKTGGEISGFEPALILGAKGLRNLDRSTTLALAASKLALDDASIATPIAETETDLFGVSLGSTLGSVSSISEFDKEALRDGPRSVNPAHFSNTVINSPASHISIRFNIQGFNATISTGFCASLDAIEYAADMIRFYDYTTVLAGGVEELCEHTYKGFYKIGHLAGSRPGKEEVNCPFDKRRNGIAFGEGAAIVVLEEIEHARKRNAAIYAEIVGYATAFDPKSRNRYNPKGSGVENALRACLDDAEAGPAEIDYISASANSTLDCDVMETRAVRNVFGRAASAVPISAMKSMFGESFSASGALSVAGCLGALAKDFVPPTINYFKPDRRCDLDYVPNEARKARLNTVLVSSCGPTGSNSALALRRYG